MSLKQFNLSTRFGIRGQLFSFLFLIALIVILTSFIGLYGLLSISTTSNQIIDREIPLARITQEALIVFLKSGNAFNAILSINDPNDLPIVYQVESELQESLQTFTALLAAITWGSESEAFRKSNNGSNYKQWRDLPYSNDLVIQTPLPAQVQLAGITNVYFGGYSRNINKAITAHIEFLKMLGAASTTRAMSNIKLLDETAEFESRSIHFSNLVVNNLSQISDRSNEAIALTIAGIELLQKKIFQRTLLMSAVGILLAFAVGYVSISRIIVVPLRVLTQGARILSEGDYSHRIAVLAKNEIGLLADIFNQMAENIEQRTSKNVKKLEGMIQELDSTAKMLIRRDLELRRANEELENLDQNKSKFVSIAAHQLRTPLSAVKWAMRMMIDGDFGALNIKQRTILMKGYESNDHMIRLVNDLLNVDRIESGRFIYKLRPIQMKDLINNVLSEFTTAVSRKKVIIKLEPSEDPLPEVFVDPEKLRQVIQNLLDNAIRYTPAGGTIQIGIFLKKPGMLTISIADSGIGIPKEVQEKVFEKFFRANNARKVETDGSGLGLYIVRGIVEKHKGAVWFESEKDKGTTFFFTLPLARG